MPPKRRVGQGARNRKLEKLKRRVESHKAARRNAQSNDSTTNNGAVPAASASTSSQAPALSTINSGRLSTGSVPTHPIAISAYHPEGSALTPTTSTSSLLSASSAPPPAISGHKPIRSISKEDRIEPSSPSPRPQPESCHGHFDSAYFQSGLEPLDEAFDELDGLHVPHRCRPPLSKSSVDLSDDKREPAMDPDNEAMNELDGISVLLVGRRGGFRLLTSR